MCTGRDCVQELQELKTPQTSQTPDYGVQEVVRMFVCASQHCAAAGVHSVARQSLFAVNTSACNENLYGHGFVANLVECVLVVIMCRSSRICRNPRLRRHRRLQTMAFKERCVCSSALLNIAQRLEIHSIARKSLFAVTTSACNEILYGHGFLANLVECVLVVIVCRSSRICRNPRLHRHRRLQTTAFKEWCVCSSALLNIAQRLEFILLCVSVFSL